MPGAIPESEPEALRTAGGNPSQNKQKRFLEDLGLAQQYSACTTLHAKYNAIPVGCPEEQ